MDNVDLLYERETYAGGAGGTGSANANSNSLRWGMYCGGCSGSGVSCGGMYCGEIVRVLDWLIYGLRALESSLEDI